MALVATELFLPLGLIGHKEEKEKRKSIEQAALRGAETFRQETEAGSLK